MLPRHRLGSSGRKNPKRSIKALERVAVMLDSSENNEVYSVLECPAKGQGKSDEMSPKAGGMAIF